MPLFFFCLGFLFTLQVSWVVTAVLIQGDLCLGDSFAGGP